MTSRRERSSARDFIALHENTKRLVDLENRAETHCSALFCKGTLRQVRCGSDQIEHSSVTCAWEGRAAVLFCVDNTQVECHDTPFFPASV